MRRLSEFCKYKKLKNSERNKWRKSHNRNALKKQQRRRESDWQSKPMKLLKKRSLKKLQRLRGLD
jgi:hypothetical protein